MSDERRVQINQIPTGVPGLDEVLGGGLPEFSFNLIVGAPGTGKTTLAHQIVFANASSEQRALYFTVLGEPALKMLRYQQRMAFFDVDKIGHSIRFINLSQEVLEKDLGKVLATIQREVDGVQPGIVVVDSFRTIIRSAASIQAGELELQAFVQELALYLAGWQATTFLVGEYQEDEMRDNPVFTVADGILWLSQSVQRNSIVRKLQVMKMRGQASMPGLHTFRITGEGLQVFPRIFQQPEQEAGPKHRIYTGVPGLEEMLGEGIQSGEAVLVAGPSGSGKTVLSYQFIAEGARRGEPGVIAVFEEHRQEYMNRAKKLGFDFEEMVGRGALKVVYIRPLDLSVDEALLEIRDAVESIGAKRVVIDSLSGFEIALAPSFREDFRESLYRLVGAMTGDGVAILMTVEVMEAYDQLRFTPHAVSFLADDIILLRYIEMDGQLRKVMTVIKMRSSDHSKDFRAYEITPHGLVVGQALTEYRGIITGVPELREAGRQLAYPGLTDQEVAVLQALVDMQKGSAEAVAQRTGLGRTVVASALDRMVDLDYAIKTVEAGQTVFRAVARPL